MSTLSYRNAEDGPVLVLDDVDCDPEAPITIPAGDLAMALRTFQDTGYRAGSNTIDLQLSVADLAISSMPPRQTRQKVTKRDKQGRIAETLSVEADA